MTTRPTVHVLQTGDGDIVGVFATLEAALDQMTAASGAPWARRQEERRLTLYYDVRNQLIGVVSEWKLMDTPAPAA